MSLQQLLNLFVVEASAPEEVRIFQIMIVLVGNSQVTLSLEN